MRSALRVLGRLGVTAILIVCARFCGALQPDILLADFEGKDYGGWKSTGEAFGSAPAQGTLGTQFEVGGYLGTGLVNSFKGGDESTGTLTSPFFKVERRLITFLIGGGGFTGKTCMNLLVDGKVARTATGSNNEWLGLCGWDVRTLKGKTAQIQIVDSFTSGWGHINVDQIVQTDRNLLMELENLRVWTRTFDNVELNGDMPFSVPLTFRFVPTKRREPDGGFEPATGTALDNRSAGCDVRVEIAVGQAKQVEIRVCGSTLVWDNEKQTVNGSLRMPAVNEKITLRAVADGKTLRLFGPVGDVLFAVSSPAETSPTDLAITAHGGAAKLTHMEVYGLRATEATPEEARLAALASRDNRVFYRSKSYTVYGGRVED